MSKFESLCEERNRSTSGKRFFFEMWKHDDIGLGMDPTSCNSNIKVASRHTSGTTLSWYFHVFPRLLQGVLSVPCCNCEGLGVIIWHVLVQQQWCKFGHFGASYIKAWHRLYIIFPVISEHQEFLREECRHSYCLLVCASVLSLIHTKKLLLLLGYLWTQLGCNYHRVSVIAWLSLTVAEVKY